jgi:hypothetical protein
MPRGDQMPPSLALAHLLILGEEKSGKTSWALAAAESGFNVLYLDGDVAQQRINDLSPEAKQRVYYMDVSDTLVGDVDPRMIQTVADFMVATRFLWNDTKQREYSRRDSHDPETGACLDEIWEIRPSRLDHNWVLVIDSWTTLSYSAMLAKAQDLGESIADVEKVERSIYSGTGNRLTNILHTQQKAPCHTIVIGHPVQYEKRKAESGKTVREAMKENDQVIEWTKMIAKSSSNPHGYSMGKFFSDIGWIDVDKWGKRKLNFEKTSERTSGGNLNSKGDPRVDHRFEDVIRKIGGTIPGAGAQDLGDALVIHPAGTYIPAAKKAPASIGGKSKASESRTLENKTGGSAAPTQVKGLGGLAGLKRKS